MCFSECIQIVANFTMGMIGSVSYCALKRASRYRKRTDMNENQPIFRRIIQAYLLKNAYKIVHSVKSYGKRNLEILTVSLWKNFSWGLTYFDEFIYKIKYTTQKKRSSAYFRFFFTI